MPKKLLEAVHPVLLYKLENKILITFLLCVFLEVVVQL